MSIANYLTFFRIFITPIFMFLYLEHDLLGISLTALPYLLLTFLVFSELSDAFDGFLARKFHQVTDLGKLLDPMADSIYRISVFLTFSQPPVNLPLLIVFIFLYRDSVISTLRTICALRGFALAARATGKIKAIIQAGSAFLVVIMLIPYSLGAVSPHLVVISWSVSRTTVVGWRTCSGCGSSRPRTCRPRRSTSASCAWTKASTPAPPAS